MIAPDGELGDIAGVNPCLLGQRALGTVLIETGHCKPAVCGNSGGVFAGDETVSITGIPDDKHADVGVGIPLDSLPLADENLAVDAEQIAPFHPRLARNGTDQQRPVDSAEPFIEVGGRNDAVQKRERAILKFHDNPLKRTEGRLDFKQLEIDRLVRAKHGAGGDAE